jgi:hypothetical protein
MDLQAKGFAGLLLAIPGTPAQGQKAGSDCEPQYNQPHTLTKHPPVDSQQNEPSRNSEIPPGEETRPEWFPHVLCTLDTAGACGSQPVL